MVSEPSPLTLPGGDSAWENFCLKFRDGIFIRIFGLGTEFLTPIFKLGTEIFPGRIFPKVNFPGQNFYLPGNTPLLFLLQNFHPPRHFFFVSFCHLLRFWEKLGFVVNTSLVDNVFALSLTREGAGTIIFRVNFSEKIRVF